MTENTKVQLESSSAYISDTKIVLWANEMIVFGALQQYRSVLFKDAIKIIKEN